MCVCVSTLSLTCTYINVRAEHPTESKQDKDLGVPDSSSTRGPSSRPASAQASLNIKSTAASPASTTTPTSTLVFKDELHISTLLLKLHRETLVTPDQRRAKNLSMSENTRLMVVTCYFKHLRDGKGKMEASGEAAFNFYKTEGSAKSAQSSYRAMIIRKWGDQYATLGKLIRQRQGAHQKTKSLIDNESVAKRMTLFVRETAPRERTIPKLVQHVKAVYDKKISRHTARRYLGINCSLLNVVYVFIRSIERTSL